MKIDHGEADNLHWQCRETRALCASLFNEEQSHQRKMAQRGEF